MTKFEMSDFKIWKFPNGEYGVQLINEKKPDREGIQLNFLFPDPLNPDIYLILLMIKTLKEKYGRLSVLNIPYIPYLRQDRSFALGNPCASQPILEILDRECIQPIFTLNAHSFNEMFRENHFIDEIDFNVCHEKFHRVAPDENAIGNSMWQPDIIFKKIRTQYHTIVLSTSKEIERNEIYKCLIIDDLCDGGASFIEAAKKLREMGYTYIGLCIAHGFFTKGIDNLFDNGIDFVMTTNSVCRLTPIKNKLRIFDCFTFEEIINA